MSVERAIRRVDPVMRTVATAFAAAAIAVAGCSAKNDDASCTTESPNATCPTPPPSWANEVSGLFAASCSPCHFPGGVEDAAQDFSTHAGVARVASTIQGQIASCAMPPADAGALTSAGRATLLAWLSCGAPDN